MTTIERDLATRIAVGEHTRVMEGSAGQGRRLRAAEAVINLVDLSDPKFQDALQAAGVLQKEVPMAELQAEIAAQVGEAAAQAEGIAAFAQRDIDTLQAHPLEASPE